MRAQLIIAIALSAGLSVARAQGPSTQSEHKAPAPAQSHGAPAAQPKAAELGALPSGKIPTAQSKVAAPLVEPKAEHVTPPRLYAPDALPQVAVTEPAAAASAKKGTAAPAKKSGPAPLPEAERNAEVQLATARVFLVDENMPAAAIEPLTNFLNLHPQHFQARLMRGYAYGRVGRYADAQADYQEALNVMTGTSADEVLARAQDFAFQRQREIALTLIEDGIRRLGPIQTLEAAALKLELALGNTDAAVDRIKGMISRTRRKEMLYAKLGDILDEAGHGAEAREARISAVQAIDQLPEAQQVGKIKRIRDDLVYRLNRASRSGTDDWSRTAEWE
jgi:tetratricopeptide (TPR) repeat protein